MENINEKSVTSMGTTDRRTFASHEEDAMVTLEELEEEYDHPEIIECRFCGEDIWWGKKVCRGCGAEVLYGMDASKRMQGTLLVLSLCNMAFWFFLALVVGFVVGKICSFGFVGLAAFFVVCLYGAREQGDLPEKLCRAFGWDRKYRNWYVFQRRVG